MASLLCVCECVCMWVCVCVWAHANVCVLVVAIYGSDGRLEEANPWDASAMVLSLPWSAVPSPYLIYLLLSQACVRYYSFMNARSVFRTWPWEACGGIGKGDTEEERVLMSEHVCMVSPAGATRQVVWSTGSANLPRKGHIINTSGFVGYTVSVTHICLYSMKAAIDKYRNKWIWLCSNNTLFIKARFDWWVVCYWFLYRLCFRIVASECKANRIFIHQYFVFLLLLECPRG
jgi:hypothetical protein